MSTDVNVKLTNKPHPSSPLNKPPSIPPPPLPPPQLTNVNSHPLKKPNQPTHHSSNNHIQSSPFTTDPIKKQPTTTTINTTNNSTINTAPCHIFGNLLLGKLETKTNDADSSPPFQASTTNDNTNTNPTDTTTNIPSNKPKPNPILTIKQRHILSQIIMTILSNSQTKKIPNVILINSRRPSLDGLYSSDTPDQPVIDIDIDKIRDSDASDKEINNNNLTVENNNLADEQINLTNKASSSPEPDFVERALNNLGTVTPMKDVANEEKGEHISDKKALRQKAKLISTQKEKLILMNSILKYIQSKQDMDTIHKACFNLWKDWYRCYGSINRQFQTAFKEQCEKLLGNVDSRALNREKPKECGGVEGVTYQISMQITELKQAFAREQLHSNVVKKNGANDTPKKNVSQIIDGMEPNVWLIVKHIIFEYFSSKYWIGCKHRLFNLFLEQYETIHRKLDREFISQSSFGVYTLICQLCEAISVNNKLAVDDGFKLDNSNHISVEMVEMEGQNSSENNTKIVEKIDDELEDAGNNSSADDVIDTTEYTNNQLLETLNWYYSVCRCENLLTNKHTDYLTYSLYVLYKPIIDPLFVYFSNESDVILSLIESICDESDFISLKNKYNELTEFKLEKSENISPKNKKQYNFLELLKRINDSCIHWICRDLYPNYRTSEFCILLTQLLAEPMHFKLAKEDSRCMRIKRLHKRFNLPSDQPLVNSFSCAFDSGKFLHHGKIYFFKDYLCFYSNMLGIRDTQQKFLLPVTEIKAITRKVTAWVFHNAIEIQMKDGRNFIFRSFIKRDVIFELLQKLINGKIDWDEIEKQQVAEYSAELQEENMKIVREEEKKNKLNENIKDQRSQSTSALQKKSSSSIMNEISGFGMGTLQKALSAIEGSSSKLLSTDAKLLLQSKKGQPKKHLANVPRSKSANTTQINKNNNLSALPEVVEMKDMTKENDLVYSAAIPTSLNGPNSKLKIMKNLKPMKITATRSAPTSPIFSTKGKDKENMKAQSDSETVSTNDKELVLYDESESESESHHSNLNISNEIKHVSNIDTIEREEEEEEEEEEYKHNINEETDEIKTDSLNDIPVVVDNNLESEQVSREELEAKVIRMNSMNNKWIFHEKPNVEKDFEIMYEYEFEGIGVDEFWDKFWGNNAIFSPVDWTKADKLNSNVQSTEWKEDGVPNFNSEQWYIRNVQCITKLDDLPSFLPKSVNQCGSDQVFRYCKLKEYFYVVHKVLKVTDIPYSDYYLTHQKLEFMQTGQVNDRERLELSTHMRFSIGFEWKKSTWLKGTIRSRSLQAIKADCNKYCEHIKDKIQAISRQNETLVQQEEEEKEMNVRPKKIKKKKKKIRPKTKVKSVIKSQENIDMKMKDSLDDDYDFVFKIGNRNSLIRCRLLLALFTRSKYASKQKNEWNTIVIVLLIILGIFILLFCLYVFSTVITLISSLLTVVTSSAEYMQQISEMNKYKLNGNPLGHLQFNNGYESLQKNYNPMEHINKHLNDNKCDENNENCQEINLNIKYCNELIYLIGINPSFDILKQTYNTLECQKIIFDDKP